MFIACHQKTEEGVDCSDLDDPNDSRASSASSRKTDLASSVNDFKKRMQKANKSSLRGKSLGRDNNDRFTQLSGSIVKILDKEARVGSHTSKQNSMSLLSSAEREKMKKQYAA